MNWGVKPTATPGLVAPRIDVIGSQRSSTPSTITISSAMKYWGTALMIDPPSERM